MASKKVTSIIEQVLNTFDDAYGGVFTGINEFDLDSFSSEYFEWLEKDLKEHYSPKKFISDTELIDYLKLRFPEGKYNDDSIMGDPELKELIKLKVVEEVGKLPFILGYKFTKLGEYLTENNLLY